MFNWATYYRKALLALSFILLTGGVYQAQSAAASSPAAASPAASKSASAAASPSASPAAGGAVQGDPQKGEDLFKQNCAACHALDKKIVGPELGGIVAKVEAKGLSPDWFHKWVKDNKALRASGDKYANEIYKEYNQIEMPLFPNLSDSDINDILAYTTNPPAPKAAASSAAAGEAQPYVTSIQDKSGAVFEGLLIIVVVIIGLLGWILYNVRRLKEEQALAAGLSPKQEKKIISLHDLYNKYKLPGQAIITLLTIAAGYGIWNWMMWIGVYKGYRPQQPIYFSHKIHAGINKIDCQLCHSGAKYGKVSEIPSLNVCMNCHKAIPEYKGQYLEPGHDRDFYNLQIQKLYAAVGWDTNTMSYTGKTHPIEWTRIHNLPAFVYFNHSRHVVAGEQEILKSYNAKHPNDKIDVVCKACHGKVDTMNVVQMANDFTMGWCIDCHRTTGIDLTSNDNTAKFNRAYFDKLHEKIKKQYGNGAKVTVDAIGGIECAKCHY